MNLMCASIDWHALLDQDLTVGRSLKRRSNWFHLSIWGKPLDEEKPLSRMRWMKHPSTIHMPSIDSKFRQPLGWGRTRSLYSGWFTRLHWHKQRKRPAINQIQWFYSYGLPLSLHFITLSITRRSQLGDSQRNSKWCNVHCRASVTLGNLVTKPKLYSHTFDPLEEEGCMGQLSVIKVRRIILNAICFSPTCMRK